MLDTSRLWRATVDKLAAEYPDVSVSHMYVDNCAMQIVKSPAQFDVIVTESMFGDILSDEASMITGSIGMIPRPAWAWAAWDCMSRYGSAPDIAGRDANRPDRHDAVGGDDAALVRYAARGRSDRKRGKPDAEGRLSHGGFIAGGAPNLVGSFWDRANWSPNASDLNKSVPPPA